jgi:hypothetical protein
MCLHLNRRGVLANSRTLSSVQLTIFKKRELSFFHNDFSTVILKPSTSKVYNLKVLPHVNYQLHANVI